MDESKVILTLLFSFSFLGILISSYFIFLQKIRLGYILGSIFILSSTATFTYAMQLSNTTESGAFHWTIVRYLTGVLYIGANLLFIIHFSDPPLKIQTWQFLGMISFPILVILFIAFNPDSADLYNQIGALSLKGFVSINWFLPLLYILLQTYACILFAFQYFILFKNYHEQTRLNQINTLIIASGISIILTSHILQLMGWRFLDSYNLTYFMYFPSSLLILWGYQRFQLGDIRPLAYNSVFNQMSEAILVLDQNSHLVDYNPSAEGLLDISAHISLGQILDPQKLHLNNFPDYQNSFGESGLRYEIKGKTYQVISSALFDTSGERNGYLISFQDISSQLEAENLRAMEIERNAVWKERRNVARILHDSIMQDMNSLILLSNTARERSQQGKHEQLPAVLDSIIESARYASREVRKLTRELQVNEGDHGFNLFQSLQERVDFVKKQCQAKISLELPAEIHLTNQVQREFFYIILEALNNAIKHAIAQQIHIVIMDDGRFVRAEVSDDGVGFPDEDSISPGMGIANMRQRAGLIGAEFKLESEPGRGVRVRLTLDAQRGKI